MHKYILSFLAYVADEIFNLYLLLSQKNLVEKKTRLFKKSLAELREDMID